MPTVFRPAFNTIIGTVVAGGTLSNEINLADFGQSAGLITLTSATSAAVTFMVSDKPDSDSGVYVDLKDAAGNYSLGTQAGLFAVSGELLKPLAPYRFVRVKFGSAQTTGLRFTFVTKA